MSIKKSMQLNAFDESAGRKAKTCISTENNLLIKKGLHEDINRLWPRQNACKIHSLHQSSADWLQNHMESKCIREGARGRKSVRASEQERERERKRERERMWGRERESMWGRKKANYPYLAAEQRCARIGRGHAYRDSSYRPPSLSQWSSETRAALHGQRWIGESSGTALNAYLKLMPWLQLLSCAVHWEQTPSLCRCCLSSVCSHVQSGPLHAPEMRFCSPCSGGGDVYLSHETLTRSHLILLQQEIQVLCEWDVWSQTPGSVTLFWRARRLYVKLNKKYYIWN